MVREHILEDLLPYICLQKACSSPQNVFACRKDWAFHMAQEHWSIWVCPLCPSKRFETLTGMKDHTSMQHTSEVPPERHEEFFRLCRTTSLGLDGGKCPLCSNREFKLLEQYQAHIFNHLRDLASSAFPEVFAETESVKNQVQDLRDPPMDSRGQSSHIAASSARIPPQTADPMSQVKPTVVHIWTCCYCGKGGMNAQTGPACVGCGRARCGNCYVEAHKARQAYQLES